VLVMIAGFRQHGPAGAWQIAGAALSLVRVMMMLIGYRILHNNQLMTVDPERLPCRDRAQSRWTPLVRERAWSALPDYHHSQLWTNRTPRKRRRNSVHGC
jgi:hypothetical protein